MTVETVTYIDDFDITLPTGTDAKSEGDDHLRNIKKGIKNSFPNIDGAVTLTPAQMNEIGVPVGGVIMYTGTIASISALSGGSVWALADGTSNAAGSGFDLRDRFIVGAYADDAGAAKSSIESATPGSGLLQSGGTGNASSIPAASTTTGVTVDGHALTISEMPTHDHTGFFVVKQSGSTYAISGGSDLGVVNGVQPQGGGATHTHGITDAGHTHTVDYPRYFALAFIERIA